MSFDPGAIEEAIRGLGALAPLGFVAAFALATVAFLPGSVFGLAGGILFGPLWGAAWNLAGGTAGATLAFLLARSVAGDWVARRAGGRLKTIVSGVEAEGWRFVALMRLVPIVPFNLLNYVLGVTRISLRHYVIATAVCMAPGAAAYAWLGYAGRAAAAGSSDALRYAGLGVAALALAVFLPRLVRRWRAPSGRFISLEQLERYLSGERKPVIIDVREPDEFAGPLGHIPGALNIPLAQLQCDRLRGEEASPVVVVCRTDRRSAKAAALLEACGLGNVMVLRGGMEAWSRGSGAA